MKMFNHLLWILCLGSTSVIAQEETLPFIHHTITNANFTTNIPLAPVTDYSKSFTGFPTFDMESNKASNLPTGIIVDTITKTKAVICQAAKGGSVKVYFSIDASGKFLGIGASSKAGIEITFKC
jgi:hypothetical protein